MFRPQETKDLLAELFSPRARPSSLTEIEQRLAHDLQGYLGSKIEAGDIDLQEAFDTYGSTDIPDELAPSTDELSGIIRQLIRRSTYTVSPRFIGHMTSALPNFMTELTKILAALNQNVVKVETSGAFTNLEKQVVAILHRLAFGFESSFYEQYGQSRDTSLGVACSGGTVANVAALWLARNKLLAPRGTFTGIREDGLAAGLEEYGYRGLCLIVSQRGHYSFEKASDLLALGRRHYWKVATDHNHRIDVSALNHALDRAARERLAPIAVIGVAGATETGTIDPLHKLATICRERRIHYHVDAAWGGPTLLSEKYRELLSGIENADTITIDAHKQLYVPVGMGFMLSRDPLALQETATHARYIIRKQSNDLGRYTLEGSRPAHALLVKGALDILGRRGFSYIIDEGIEKTRAFAEMIDGTSDFEVITRPELNIMCYRYCPHFTRDCLLEEKDQQETPLTDLINRFTEDLQVLQRNRGHSFVSRTHLFAPIYGAMTTVLRVVLANPLTTIQILRDILEEQRVLAAEVIRRDEAYLRLFQQPTRKALAV